MQNSSACIALRAETSGSVCWRGRKKKTSTLPPSSSPHPFPCISSHPSPHPSPPPLRTHLGQALKVLIEKFAKSDSGDSSGIGNSGDRGWPLSPQDVSTWTQRAQVFGQYQYQYQHQHQHKYKYQYLCQHHYQYQFLYQHQHQY